ncbi:MAG: beta-ketoacyl synthase N-terminal-like domain-containing protein [Gammaproteobacteria bacterium]
MSDQSTLHKALYTIKKLKQLLQEQQKQTFEPIAITGLSCRFPDAIGKDAYWKMLIEGRNIISPIPQERWDLLKGTDEIGLRDPEHPYLGGYLADIAAFDAYFFGISPREALRMDPQHRLLLEVAYEAIEDAGIPVEDLAGSKTGVFSSLYVSQLAHMQTMDNELDALFLPTGNAISIAANRISYLFDLHGPSIVVDSACSSSMTSLYLACLNIQNKSCDLALVCGAKLNILPYINYVLSKAKMLSPDGQCKTFDAGANGYAQGEGVGVVVLKPLAKALQDNDRIYGVITGCAVNQDGKTNGLTAPNGLQQELMLKTAYDTAKINPHDLSYIECHGTGTFLGDPIEIEALGEVIGKQRDKQKPCWIGSVKTNIGHLEPAAGVASIIKVALALKNTTIPPHLNFTTPNPHIAFDKYNLRVPKQSEAWPKYGDYRMAGVSGFGFGGTNAHVVIRELSENEQPRIVPGTRTQDEIFTLSAKDPTALSLAVEKWCRYLENHPEIDIARICYNTHVRRSHYFYRLAIVANSTVELLAALRMIMANPITKTATIFTNIEKSKNSVKPSAPTAYNQIPSHQLAALYVDHANINWKRYEEARSYPQLDMPLYPWQHKNYWPPLGHKELQLEDASYNQYPLRGKAVKSPLETLQYEFRIDSRLIPDVQDTYNILHAGYYLEILAFAVNQMTGQNTYTVEDHEFLSPLMAPNDTLVNVQLTLKKIDEHRYLYHFYSNIYGQPNWVEHAKGFLTPSANVDKKTDSIVEIKNRCTVNEKAEKLYEKVIAMGMPAGESIRWTQQFWRNDKEILCEFQQPKFAEKNSLFTLKIHPGIIDGCIQPIFKLLPDDLIKPYIASGAQRMKFHGMKEGPYYLYGTLKSLIENGEKMIGDCYLINAHNEIMAEFENICLTQLDNKIQIEQIMQSKERHNLDLASLSQDERKPAVINFLVEQIAIIFSMPKEDIEVNRSLRDMGIDSLMALVLMRTLELGLGTTYSMHDLLEGPTITELADFVVLNHQSNPNSAIKLEQPKPIDKKANWISFRKARTNPQARLFCFPYGGGGASIYRQWQNDLPEDIEVCPIQLPGREDRFDEKPIGNMDTLIENLVENLQPELNIPFAFFGHSFGSLIAFELARSLRKRGLPMPMHLFVSAFPDPRVPTKSLDTLLKQLNAININMFAMDAANIAKLSDEQLSNLSKIFNENGITEYGEHIMDKEIIKVLLPIFTGDMGLVKSHQYRDEAPLDLPITVFMGKRDTWVALEDHLNWIDHTKQKCVFHVYDSGHLFVRDAKIKQDILHKITGSLVTEKAAVVS